MSRVLSRWLLLPAACIALSLPAQAQTSGTQRKPAPTKPAAKKPAAKKAPARKPAAKPVPRRTPAPAPAAAPAAVPAAPVATPAPAPASAALREADFIVAVVNTEPVTNNEVRARIARAQRQLAERGGPQPPADVLRKEMLERLIAERAQLQYARETGLKVDDGALAQAELSIARQNQLPPWSSCTSASSRKALPCRTSATTCATRCCWRACASARSSPS